MEISKFNGTLDIYYASAGTGKTHQLMDIIDKHLKDGVPIDRIAFVTFTRKGAEVARLRTAEQFGIALNNLNNFRTIHSLAFRGCKARRDFMMDEAKYKDFGEQAGFNFGALSLNSTEGTDWSQMHDQQLIQIEQLYRNNPKYCEMIMDGRCSYGELSTFIKLYTQYKRALGYKDFTDLLEEDINSDCYEDVDVVCLDEMQDSSILQWQLVFKAFAHAKHMYVAGDVKQAVYCFAGASADTMLKLKGTPHLLETSYRVPSNILSYVQNIVDVMQVKDESHCISKNNGGEVEFISEIDELEMLYNREKTYFFLCRNRKYFKYYERWCRQNGLPYCLRGEPVFTSTDLLEYREGRTDLWDVEKLEFARYCYSRGTLYDTPKINISTIHAVKGDEADIVVLMSDISKAVSSQLDIDEDSEHRVFYVACTRAKEKLVIVQPQTKLYYPYLF